MHDLKIANTPMILRYFLHHNYFRPYLSLNRQTRKGYKNSDSGGQQMKNGHPKHYTKDNDHLTNQSE